MLPINRNRGNNIEEELSPLLIVPIVLNVYEKSARIVFFSEEPQ